MIWCYSSDLRLAAGILKCSLVPRVCASMYCVVIKRTKTCTRKTWKIAIFSTPRKHSHWLRGCIQKAKTFIALLAEATFLHRGAVQRKSTKNHAHHSAWNSVWTTILIGSDPFTFFSIIWKGASNCSWIEPTEMNFPWKLLETLL